MSRPSPMPHTPIVQQGGHISRQDATSPREEELADRTAASHASSAPGRRAPHEAIDPRALSRSAVVALQRTHGNAHVQRLLRIQRDPQAKALAAAKADAAAAKLSVAALHKLAALRDHARLSLGKSRGGRDVKAHFFKGAISDVALVIAGVHGSELSGVEVAETLIKRLSAKGAPKPYYSVVIVPQLFPDNVDAKRVWEASQAKAAKQLTLSEYKKARDMAGDPGRDTKDRRHGATDETNRQFPELGKPFDPSNPVDAKERPIERENILLLSLIDRFKPVRIAALHAKKALKDAGIYADPHPSLKKLSPPQKKLANEAHELTKRMAEAAKKQGAKVPGNWPKGTFTSLYPGQNKKISAAQMKREDAKGRSLGQWGPSQGMVVITVELNEQYASDSPVKHPGRKKEIDAHAETLQEIFLGPEKQAAVQPSALPIAATLAAMASSVSGVGLPLALAASIAIDAALRQLGISTKSGAGPSGAPSGSTEVKRQLAGPDHARPTVEPKSRGMTVARQAAPAPATVKHYTLQSGVTLSAAVEKKVAEIADDYYADRKKDIVVTSGTRTASSQAGAMYTKLEAGDDIVKLYVNKTAVKEIKKAYDDGKAAKKARADIVDDMTKVIEKQIKAGTYISKHLRVGAVDVRSKDMSADEKKAFRKAAKGKATKIILETKPPHWHLQF